MLNSVQKTRYIQTQRLLRLGQTKSPSRPAFGCQQWILEVYKAGHEGYNQPPVCLQGEIQGLWIWRFQFNMVMGD